MVKKKQAVPDNPFTEFLLYTTPNGKVKIEVILHNETVWLTQDQMATLFGKGRSTVAEHIANVFEEGELEQNPTCRKFRQVRTEGIGKRAKLKGA
ncbi:MAG: hypothetical protein ACOX2F_05005 [bacterium]